MARRLALIGLTALVVLTTLALAGCGRRAAETPASTDPVATSTAEATGSADATVTDEAGGTTGDEPVPDDLSAIEAELEAIEAELRSLDVPEDSFADVESALY